MLYTRLLATGKLAAWHDQRKHNFVTVDVELSATSNFEDIVRKIGTDFAAKLRERESVKSLARDAWDFLKKWEIAGTRFHANPDGGTTDIIETLGDTFIKANTALGTDVDGILILIDEADKPGAQANLGGFLKLFTERLTKRDCHRVAIGCSGISTVIEKLKESHPSSLRILNHIKLEPLSGDERKEVVMRGLEEANRECEKHITIQPDALDWIAGFSEGYPHFLQQYAFSAFEADTDSDIQITDVMQGAYKDNGALDQLGTNYFEEMYSGQIDSDEYRKVLQAMAENESEYMSRQDVKATTGLKETTLSNALRALRNKRIILTHPEKSGLYKLPTDSFAVWIRAKAQRDKEKNKSRHPFH